ncbi:MAG: hypothetical protein JKY15_03280, partial [Deltaproteobacteria bacterium]|nr:hypothetical protein [Deltaproteobacteria bacterium]
MSKVKLSKRAEKVWEWVWRQAVTPASEPGSSKIDWIPDQVRDDGATLPI